MGGITYTIDFAAAIARLEEGTAKSAAAVKKMAAEMETSSNFARDALAALGVTLSVGYFVNFLKNTNDAVARMKELGQEAGTSAEAISRFDAPARMAGLGLDAVATAMFKMSKASLEAKDPQSQAAQALNAIGISTERLKGLKPDEMFELVARSLGKYGDGLTKNNVMLELFGKSGREMNRVVAEIADTQKLAATVTNEQVDAAKLLDKQIVELTMNSEKFWRSLVADGVPALNEILKAFLEARKEGSLFDGIFVAMATSWNLLKAQSPAEELAKVNAEIKLFRENESSRASRSFLGIEPGKAREEIKLLERRVELERIIFDQEFAAQLKRQTEFKFDKPKIDFDPKREADASKAAQAQANAFIAFNEQIAKDNAAMWDEANKDVLKNQEIIYTQRLELAASYALALQNENLSEEENLSSSFTQYEQKKMDAIIAEYEAQRRKNELISNMEMNTWRLGAELLQVYAGKSKAAAIAVIAITKGLAMAQVIQQTAQARMMVMGDPTLLWPAKVAALATVETMSAIQIGLIAATGLAQAGGVGGGGASVGSPANPVNTISPFMPSAGAAGSSQSQVVINVNIINNAPIVGVDGAEQLINDIVIPGLKDVIDNNDVVIIGRNSRQAADLASV